jgi:quercetin dioxygenase-like cupin family protein
VIFLRSDAKPVEMFPGVTRRTLAYGQSLLLAEFTYEKGARAPLHHHPHEQITYVVEGRYEVTIAGVLTVVEKGDSYLIPSNVEHGQFALERPVTADIGHPPREDYLE